MAAWDYGRADYAIATGTGSCVTVAQAVCHAEIELSVAVRMQSVGSTGFVVILGSWVCNRWRKKWFIRSFLLGGCMGLYGRADYAIATGTGSCVEVAQAVCHAAIELSVAVWMQSVGSTGFVVILGSWVRNRWQKKWFIRSFLLGGCMGLWEGRLCNSYGYGKLRWSGSGCVCHAEIEVSVAIRMQSVGSTGFVVILGSWFRNRWQQKWFIRSFLLGGGMGLWEGRLCNSYGYGKLR